MNCPKCGYPQYCGCESCRKTGLLPKGIKPYVWDETGELISCGNCGFTMHADGWLNEAEKQLKDSGEL